MTPLSGHDNYQKVYDAAGGVLTGGARSNKRLRMINWNVFKDKRVLDIGCNSGMLSLHAKKMGAVYVLGVDAKPVIQVAQKMAAERNLDVDFRSMDMESDEFQKITAPGFDITFFCAMFSHVRPENRIKMLQYIDRITNEVLIFETNFEGKPDKYLPLLRKYFTFDKELYLGPSGDRKQEDYHLYRFERHRNEPYEAWYLPEFMVNTDKIHFCTAYPNIRPEKKKTEDAKIARLTESIETNGQVRPCLVVRNEGETAASKPWVLREGGHRLIVLKQLGLPVRVRDITGHVFKRRTDV